MSKLDKDQVIEQFTQAYTAANGKAPEIEAAGGWYSVDGGKKMRLAALQEMKEEMSGGSTAAAAESKSTPKAKKSEAKPAAKKPKKESKPVSGGFSVKQYWAEQILANNPGSKLPR